MSLMDRVKDLANVNTLPKHEQLVQGAIESIDSGILVMGGKFRLWVYIRFGSP